jgi:hypothetical protein
LRTNRVIASRKTATSVTPNSADRSRSKLWVILTVVVITAILSGCTSVTARLIESAISDPRTKNHAYNAKVVLVFSLGGKQLAATRFAEVWYLTGGTSDYRWPPCDETKPSCWGLTDHFFIGLPNGDILDIFVNRSSISLKNMIVDHPIHVAAQLAGIYRDQVDKPAAKEFGPCLQLNDESLERDYNLAPPKGVESRIKIAVDITRTEGNSSKYLVFEPAKFYRSIAFDHEPCGRLIKTIAGQTAINTR